MLTVHEGDVTRFSTDATSVNLPAALADCRETLNDRATTPVPDAAIEAHWGTELSDFAASAPDQPSPYH
jgi:hypothetical protein